MAFLFALVFFGIAAIGLLPPSPFRVANGMMINLYTESISFLRYLPVFIPFFEILMILNAWIAAIVIWYAVKVALRIGKIIT